MEQEHWPARWQPSKPYFEQKLGSLRMGPQKHIPLLFDRAVNRKAIHLEDERNSKLTVFGIVQKFVAYASC